MTVWTERHEVFLEHGPIVVGTAVTFVTHVSEIATGEPRNDGPITFVLGDATPAHEVQVPAPARPGIYLPEIVFPSPGTSRVRLRIPGREPEDIADLGDFQVHATREDAARAPAQEAPEGITFLKEQQWKLLLLTEKAGRSRLVERLPLPGSVAARPGARASVTPPLAGRLLPPRGGSLPTIGDRAEAGQIVARIEPPLSDLTVRIIDADAATTRARIALEQAEALLDRTMRLAQESARSPRELEDAKFAARRARAEHEAASAIKASYEKTGLVLDPQADGGASPSIELRAPISGTVVRVGAAMGEHVVPERSVVEILDATRVVVEARVPEADAGRLAPALAASYEVPGVPGSRVPIVPGGSGRLLQVGLEVDPATRTIPIAYEVDNPGGALRIGQAVVVHLETRHVQEGIAIPWSAIVDEDVRTVVFVEVSGESFEKREVTLGVRDGDRVEVLSGVAEGERVVSRGAYAVRLASVSSSIPAHGHAH